MSRNIGQKNKKPPARQQRRRRISDTSSSSIDLSDDGGYSAVEEVTDSEDDDEEDVDAAEEEHIITDELHPPRSTGSPRPEQDDAEDADEEGEDEEEEEDDEEDVEDASSWNGILSEVDSSTSSQQHVEDALFYQDTPIVERHVRFAGIPDSDSDSTTSEATDHNGDFFPDIFVEQTALDPAFRREVEEDPDDSSNSGSFWDFQGAYEAAYNSFPVEVTSDDETPMPTPMASQAASEVCSPVAEAEEYQELDGYESDGETTEEDVPEPPKLKKQVRRAQPVESSDSDTEKPTKPLNRGKPRVGRFHLDSSDSRPIAVVNPITRKMMIFTPQRMRRLDLSPESFNIDPESFHMDQYFGTPGVSTPGMTEASPILSNSGTMMFGAMFASHTFGDFINTQPMGPEEAFFSTAGSGAFPVTESDFSDMDDIEEDEAENQLKISDFLTLSDDDSGDQGDDDGANGWDEETNDDLASTPGRRPSTAVSTTSEANLDVHPLLAHFDGNSGTVGAFRRNQVNQQLILSDKATKESLLFSNKYSMGTLRGVRSDSLGTVAAPLTPARRRKRDMNVFDNINSSPLDTISQKRKASAAISEAQNHKRHRSISDVQALQI